MTKLNHKSAIVFGLCVIIASLSSGCALSPRVDRIPMGIEELNSGFQIDCSRKQQQIQMLESMRQSRDDSMEAQLRTWLQPWRALTNAAEHRIDLEISQGNPNKFINYHLNQLRYCP